MDTTEKEYIGDGVYASYEAGMILLETEREHGIDQIFLEPEVYTALVKYAQRCWPTPERA